MGKIAKYYKTSGRIFASVYQCWVWVRCARIHFPPVSAGSTTHPSISRLRSGFPLNSRARAGELRGAQGVSNQQENNKPPELAWSDCWLATPAEDL